MARCSRHVGVLIRRRRVELGARPSQYVPLQFDAPKTHRGSFQSGMRAQGNLNPISWFRARTSLDPDDEDQVRLQSSPADNTITEFHPLRRHWKIVFLPYGGQSACS